MTFIFSSLTGLSLFLHFTIAPSDVVMDEHHSDHHYITTLPLLFLIISFFDGGHCHSKHGHIWPAMCISNISPMKAIEEIPPPLLLCVVLYVKYHFWFYLYRSVRSCKIFYELHGFWQKCVGFICSIITYFLLSLQILWDSYIFILLDICCFWTFVLCHYIFSLS